MANDIYVKIMNALKERLGEEYSLKLDEFSKNNIVRTGLSVRKNGLSYAPIIYLDGVDYEKYEFSHVIDEYEKIINGAFEQMNSFGEPEELFNNFKSLDFVKANIKPALLSKQGNESFLKDRVMRDFVGGLVVVYNVSLDDTRSIPVNKSHLSLWGISEEDELFNWAMANAQFEVTDMNEIIAGMVRRKMEAQGMPDELIEEAINSMRASVPDMLTQYVLTTKDKRYGAAAMLSAELLNEVSGKLGGNDLFIMPSSVHEIIVCRAEGSPATFEEMIRSVNTSQVKPEERLSDRLFYFDAKKKEVRLADEADNEPIDLATVAV